MLFLDANAHVPLNEFAVQELIKFNKSIAGSGHAMSPSVPGRAAATAIEESRATIANVLGAKSADQIIFTSSCTQACEWAVNIFYEVCHKRNYSIYCSPTEHPAIRQAVDSVGAYTELDIDCNGVVSSLSFPDAGCICTHIQNEIGIIQPIEDIGCEFLLSDMCQSAGKVDINLSRMCVDIAVFGGHKFGGMTSTGFMYLKDPSTWEMFGTGSRYFMDRPGTPDAASIVATAAALKEAQRTLPERTQRMKEFQAIIEPAIKNMGFEIVSEKANRCYGTTFVSMPNGKGFSLMSALGEHGIYVGLGSACGSAHTGASPLIRKLGRKGGPHDYMRISQFGMYGLKEAEIFVNMFNKCIKE